jgi:hypothetical protein
MLRHGLDQEEPWLRSGEPVAIGNLFSVAAASNLSPRQVAVRLAEFGFQIEGAIEDLPIERLSRDDLIMLSHDLDQEEPWLTPAEPVAIGHIFRAAFRVNVGPRQVAPRFSQMGFQIEGAIEDLPTESASPDDLIMLSRDLDQRAPWLTLAEPVAVGHLLAAAAASNLTPQQVAERLTRLGFEVDFSRVRTRPGGH